MVQNLREISCDLTVSPGKFSGPVTLKPTVTKNVRVIIEDMDV